MASDHKKDPFLIRHLKGSQEGRFPVWLMRQAGRYLPAYRAIRKDHTFWEMVTRPDVAATVSLMPLEYLKVDAVIFFSDILTLPYGMGLPITMKESIGPVIETPLRDEKAFDRFASFSPTKHTEFVSEAMRKVRKGIPDEVTLIGFAGAPWTVGCYLVEGQGKQGFTAIQDWMKRDPQSLSAALTQLTDATISYLKSQVAAGSHIVQLFDTWLGSMSLEFFQTYYHPQIQRIISELQRENVPVTYFAKGAKPFLSEIKKLTANVLGVETDLTMKNFDQLTGQNFSLQGNLSPKTLKADISELRLATRKLVAEARTLAKPAILNLGHGVEPDTPVENVKAFVDEARHLWI